jgi:hypothetical protein
MLIFPHPPYSLDLAPWFHLFCKLQMKLKGQRFDTVSDMQAVLYNIKENYFHVSFQGWKKQKNHYIRSQGTNWKGMEVKIQLSKQFF